MKDTLTDSEAGLAIAKTQHTSCLCRYQSMASVYMPASVDIVPSLFLLIACHTCQSTILGTFILDLLKHANIVQVNTMAAAAALASASHQYIAIYILPSAV